MKTTELTRETAIVELYNLFEKGCRFPKNGWYVARYLADGRRANTLADFKTDEDAARKFAAAWNAQNTLIP